MEYSEMETQAHIIFGEDLISAYGISNYIIKPDKYQAIEPPTPAPEELVDNWHVCISKHNIILRNIDGYMNNQ